MKKVMHLELAGVSVERVLIADRKSKPDLRRTFS
jgi:hypothetical protein